MTQQFWSFLSACIAIALNAGGFLWQAWSIFKKRSGDAVSVAWFTSSVGLEAVNLIYGWSKGDWLFINNAIVCAVGQIIVLLALRIYKPFGKKEKALVTAMIAIIAAAVALPFKSSMQVVAQAVNIYAGWDQPIQLKAGRDTGALELWALISYGVSASIWTVYCWIHFGFWGPAVGYLVFTAYSVYMIWRWVKKARSAKSS